MSSSSSSSLSPSSSHTDIIDVVNVDPYKSSSFIGHSLWMVPSGDSDSNLLYSKLIADTAKELGTFEFLPHITLVAAIMKGEEDCVKRAKALAAELTPYTFEFDGDISYRDAYFQCVYAQFKRTDAVVHANTIARIHFPERQSDPEYTPHMSLVYGDFDKETKQTQIIPKLKSKIAANERSGDSDSHNNCMTLLPVDTIEVWSTQGDVKEWYKVTTIPLTGGK